MPKWFSEIEKETIRQKLIDQGYRQFSQFGFKKTNVDEIAKAAGISKGAFYRFYESKEMLFMDVIEQVEQKGRVEIMTVIEETGPSPRARLYTILKKAFDLFGELPILHFFTSSDFDMIATGVPAQKFQEHIASDQGFFDELFSRCQKAGIPIKVTSTEMVNLLYPLVIAFLMKNKLDGKGFGSNIDSHLELIAAYCLGEVTLQFTTPESVFEEKKKG
ncbi:TetR/AcrR family transcriptional regulator [Leptolinea tardivitalis]|uniref:TetR/AcrR family transcriptional regulator n=1 Tax=Leptolinea tardivitalis TaxID=229920 RepID=UPI0007862F97|nr:TetR/AcrR family transcriptional regulator [Leptolinea tardivitalis]GAP20108.1 transcriptional regulator, TetR family [Leptolinea tardivitalis]